MTGSGWRALALLLLGVAETLEGDIANARSALEEAVVLSHGETSTGATSLAYLALIALARRAPSIFYLEHASSR